MKKNNNMSSLLGLLIVLVLAVGALIVFVSQMNGDGDVSSPVSDVSINDISSSDVSDDLSSADENNSIDISDTIEDSSSEPSEIVSNDESSFESKDESEEESKNESKEESTSPEEPVYTYEYKIDITDYLQYIEPSDKNEYLFLVN